MNLVREPDAGNPPVRFDEREVETEHGMRLLRHRPGKPRNRLCRSLTHRATSRLYPFLITTPFVTSYSISTKNTAEPAGLGIVTVVPES